MVMSGAGEDAARERLSALWRRIERAHYSYLETEDSPDKIRQRNKLEGYIVEYLSLVPHECKFGLSETSKVFARTVAELAEYSAYRAGLGWAALGRYAANLLAQPWRKEYREIRLYSGYYKHEVESNMVGAECLLRLMGYQNAGAGRMQLTQPLCADTIAAVSRDALVAQTECQMMCQIWEAVWQGGRRVSWADVARERVLRAGSAAQGAASLARAHDGDSYTNGGSSVYANVPVTVSEIIAPDVRYHHNLTQQSATFNDSPPTEDLNMVTPYVNPMAPNIMPPMYPMYPMVPQEMVPSQPMGVQMMTPYGVPYYYPVQTPYMIPTPVFAPIKHAATIPVNGYHPVPQQYRYPAVPTAQLIELEPPLFENGTKHGHREDERHKKRLTESSRRYSTSKSGFSDVSLPSLPRSDTQPALSKAREDGMGTYESWDYVFRNLSSKDEPDRNRLSPSLDRDSRTLDRLDRDERRSKYQPTTLDLEDGLQALNLDRSYDEDTYRTAKVNENLMRLKQEQELKKAKQLKKVESKRRVEAVPNPPSDALINTKVAQDKIKLLSKKDVKDRKEVIKQQSFNGPVPTAAEARKIKKPAKLLAPESDRHKRPLENGHSNGAIISNAAISSSQPYDLKSQLVVSLDEPDSVPRKSPPRLNGDRDRQPSIERPSSRSERPSSRSDRPSSRSERPSSRSSSQPNQNGASQSKWQCGTCTYLNQGTLQACEMCGKSKKGPEIQPLTSGGRECPTCTLVNQREARVCEACGTSLEHCPTYI